MKKITYLDLIIIVFVLGYSSGSTREQTNLLLYFPFDGKVENIITKNCNVVIKDVLLITERFGNEKSAYNFNGVTSSISISLKKYPKYKEAQSVSWWYFLNRVPKYNGKYDAKNKIAIVDTLNGTGIQFGFRSPEYKIFGFDT